MGFKKTKNEEQAEKREQKREYMAYLRQFGRPTRSHDFDFSEDDAWMKFWEEEDRLFA